MAINSGTTRLIINNTLSAPIYLHSGLKQGNSFSLVLFVLCLHPTLFMLNTHTHANDTLLLVYDIKELNTALKILYYSNAFR